MLIYHMCKVDEWVEAEKFGVYPGSSQDRADGFTHFSTAHQIRVTAAKHRTGQEGLVLLSVEADVLGAALKWEPSRDGQVFPHLDGELEVSHVVRIDLLSLDAAGLHIFPVGLSDNLDGEDDA